MGPKCPECVAGKHGNCDGTAWNFDTDELAECICANDNHLPVEPFSL